MLNLPTAQEAKERALKVCNEEEEAQALMVKEAVEAAIEKGKTSCVVNINVCNSLANKLGCMGYIVFYDSINKTSSVFFH